MKIKTTELTALVTKAINGASNNKMLPITSLMLIKAESHTLTLETTDTTNYLFVSATIDDEGLFYAVVNADVFTKLISKCSNEYTTLTVKDNVLEIVSNGTYKIPMQLGEDGEVIKYPNPMFELPIPIDAEDELTVADIQNVYNRCNGSLSDEISEVPVSEYYFGDRIITTDSIRLSSINQRIFERDMVLNSRLVKLLCSAPEDKLGVKYSADAVLFESPTYSVFCTRTSDVSKYPNVMGLLEDGLQFEGECVVSKHRLLNCLDRMSLFVNSLSENCVHLIFGADSLTIVGTESAGTEIINYDSVTNASEFECNLDIALLITQLKMFKDDAIALCYNNNVAVKMIQDDVIQILCLHS